MNEFRARIGRIRMKNGGADVHVIDRNPVNPEAEEWRGKIVSHARMIAEMASEDDPMTGYFILGMFAKGGTSTAFRYDPERSPIPRALIPAWIEEVARRDILMAGEAEGVFNQMFEGVE